jgi:hypothetical protein
MLRESSQSGYVAALHELAELRDQLVAGRVSPENVERFAVQAAAAVEAGRAALRRAGASVDRLSVVVDGSPSPRE